MIEPAEIVLLLGIQLHREVPEKLLASIAHYRHDRTLREPTQRHAGSIFKDPVGTQASQLIEQAGLKGKTHGKAQIAERNANYIVNLGGAQAADIAALIVQTHQAVQEQFGVDLELDVELHGEWNVSLIM
jgi:UDP-N-acetylmuramate dehydrogenase